jgi:hypothetical protein
VDPARISEEGIRLLPPQVRAVQDVTASNAGELSYKKGDIIDVELRSTAEQWQGRLGTQVGSFHLDRSVVGINKIEETHFTNIVIIGTNCAKSRTCDLGLLVLRSE